MLVVACALHIVNREASPVRSPPAKDSGGRSPRTRPLTVLVTPASRNPARRVNPVGGVSLSPEPLTWARKDVHRGATMIARVMGSFCFAGPRDPGGGQWCATGLTNTPHGLPQVRRGVFVCHTI